jgi:Putative addiction module component
MTNDVEELEAAVLALPEEARRRIAHALFASLEDDTGPSDAWLDEIERRSAQVDRGEVRLIGAEEAFARSRTRLRAVENAGYDEAERRIAEAEARGEEPMPVESFLAELRRPSE